MNQPTQRRGRRDQRDGDRRSKGGVQSDGLTDKTIGVDRVAKVVKGGRIFRFAALVVVGDGKGRVGFGRGKAREVPIAVEKATQVARQHLVSISLTPSGTLYYPLESKYGATKVMIRPAPDGTGIIAGSSVRAILELLGVQDAVTKIHGSNNKINVVRAVMNALRSQETPDQIAARRGRTLAQIGHREAVLNG